MFIIGNPTNIFLGTSAGIDFINYAKVMALPTLAAGLVEVGIIFLLFNRKLRTKIEIPHEEENVIQNKLMLIVGVIHLGLCLIF